MNAGIIGDNKQLTISQVVDKAYEIVSSDPARADLTISMYDIVKAALVLNSSGVRKAVEKKNAEKKQISKKVAAVKAKLTKVHEKQS